MGGMIDRVRGLIVVGAALYWVSVVLAMHVVEPEYSPLRAPMSAYVRGAYGTWMTSTYFVLSAALVCLGLSLRRTLPRSRAARIAFVLFCVAATGAVLAGFFPMDFPGPPSTSSGRLHALGGALTFPAWVLGTLLFSLSFRGDPDWSQLSGSLLAIAGAIVGALLLGIASLLMVGFAGYAQRLLVALLFIWMVLVVRQLLRLQSGNRV